MAEVAEQFTIDELREENISPDLYRPVAEADGLETFADCPDAQVATFHEQGYLVFRRAFSRTEVQAALDGILDVIDGKYPEHVGIQYEAKARALLSTLSRERRRDAVRKVSKLAQWEPRVRAIVEHPSLLPVLARLLGAPPVLENDQALLKPPLIGREKPWHQDLSAFNLPPDSPFIGTWVALDDVGLDNGCMHVIPGSHRDGPVVHFKRRDFQICDTQVAIDRVVAVPLPPGGCLLFHGLLHHGTPPNRSPRRRRALQFWYRPADLAHEPPGEHQAIWGGEMQGESCP